MAKSPLLRQKNVLFYIISYNGTVLFTKLKDVRKLKVPFPKQKNKAQLSTHLESSKRYRLNS